MRYGGVGIGLILLALGLLAAPAAAAQPPDVTCVAPGSWSGWGKYSGITWAVQDPDGDLASVTVKGAGQYPVTVSSSRFERALKVEHDGASQQGRVGTVKQTVGASATVRTSVTVEATDAAGNTDRRTESVDATYSMSAKAPGCMAASAIGQGATAGATATAATSGGSTATVLTKTQLANAKKGFNKKNNGGLPPGAAGMVKQRIEIEIEVPGGTNHLGVHADDDGSISSIERLSDDERRSFDPQLTLHADGETVEEIEQSNDSMRAALDAVDSGDITFASDSVTAEAVARTARAAGRLLGSADGEQSSSENTRPSALGYEYELSNASGFNNVTGPDGETRGVTTQGCQELISIGGLLNLSPNAGVYEKPKTPDDGDQTGTTVGGIGNVSGTDLGEPINGSGGTGTGVVASPGQTSECRRGKYSALKRNIKNRLKSIEDKKDEKTKKEREIAALKEEINDTSADIDEKREGQRERRNKRIGERLSEIKQDLQNKWIPTRDAHKENWENHKEREKELEEKLKKSKDNLKKKKPVLEDRIRKLEARRDQIKQKIERTETKRENSRKRLLNIEQTKNRLEYQRENMDLGVGTASAVGAMSGGGSIAVGIESVGSAALVAGSSFVQTWVAEGEIKYGGGKDDAIDTMPFVSSYTDARKAYNEEIERKRWRAKDLRNRIRNMYPRRINDLEQKRGETTAKIRKLERRIDDMQERVENLERELDQERRYKKNEKERYEDWKDKVEKQEKKIRELEEAKDEEVKESYVQAGVDKTKLKIKQDRVSDLKGQIDKLEEKIETDRKTIEVLRKRLRAYCERCPGCSPGSVGEA